MSLRQNTLVYSLMAALLCLISVACGSSTQATSGPVTLRMKVSPDETLVAYELTPMAVESEKPDGESRFDEKTGFAELELKPFSNYRLKVRRDGKETLEYLMMINDFATVNRLGEVNIGEINGATTYLTQLVLRRCRERGVSLSQMMKQVYGQFGIFRLAELSLGNVENVLSDPLEKNWINLFSLLQGRFDRGTGTSQELWNSLTDYLLQMKDAESPDPMIARFHEMFYPRDQLPAIDADVLYPHFVFGNAGVEDFLGVTQTSGSGFEETLKNMLFPLVTTPVIVSTPESSVAKTNYTWFYYVNAIDQDGDTVSYSLIDAPEGMQIQSNTGRITWMPPAVLGDISFTVIASDGMHSGYQTVHLTVIEGIVEYVPDIIVYSNPPSTISAGKTYEYYVVATNNKNDNPLSYSLSAGSAEGAVLDPDTRILSWTPTIPGEYPFTIQVSDGQGSIDHSWTVTVVEEQEQDLSPPEITSTAPTQAYSGIEYVYQVEATDNMSESLSYRFLDNIRPEGMVISSTGLVTWTPELLGSYQMYIVVSDGINEADQNVTIKVVFPE